MKGALITLGIVAIVCAVTVGVVVCMVFVAAGAVLVALAGLHDARHTSGQGASPKDRSRESQRESSMRFVFEEEYHRRRGWFESSDTSSEEHKSLPGTSPLDWPASDPRSRELTAGRSQTEFKTVHDRARSRA